MDINNFKKHAIPQIEVGRMINIVRETIKEDYKNIRQDKYEGQKELFKPVTKELRKEIDEISHLREEFVKSAKPITYTQQVQRAITDGREDTMSSNLDAGFSNDEFAFLRDNELPKPSKLLKQSIRDNDKDVATRILTQVSNLNRHLGQLKGSLSKGQKQRTKNADKIGEYTNRIDTIRKYRERVAAIKGGYDTITIGKGYTHVQPKRNAYKIGDRGEYGNLFIDLPKLFGDLQMVAYKMVVK